MLYVSALLVVCLLAGCAPKEEAEPPVPPPPEDLSSWSVPELVQSDRQKLDALVAQVSRVPPGPAEKVVDYAPGMTVEVPVALGTPLDIVLEPGEQVRQIVDGDRAPLEQGQVRRWEVKEGGDGTGAGLRAHVFVTVTNAGLTNGVTITTSKRVYYILCKSVQKSPVRVLRWHYGQESLPPGPTEDVPGLLPSPDAPRQYHVGYAVASRGRVPDWMPRAVADDGKKLYVLYPEVTLYGSVPLVRAIGVNGPQLVNSRQYLNVVMLDALVPRLELRVGIGEAAEVVTITRGTLRTIQCPGDTDCPHFPGAAHILARRQP
jgi:type IV secretory pathway VirB9-like protein